jgi:hypothetical protein
MTPQAHLGRGVNPNRHRPAVLAWRLQINPKQLHSLFAVALKAMPNTPTKGTQGLVQVAAFVEPEIRDHLRDLGDGNISQGLRLAICSPDYAPSGALWVGHECQLPDPRHGGTGPMVLAMAEGVLAEGIGPSSLLIDAEAGKLAFIAPGDAGAITDIGLADLALMAGRLVAAVLAACAHPDAAVKTQVIGPLRITRLGHGLVELAPAGAGESPDCAVCLPIRQALQLAAEVAGLLARRVEQHQMQVAGLNSTLAEPMEVQP